MRAGPRWQPPGGSGAGSAELGGDGFGAEGGVGAAGSSGTAGEGAAGGGTVSAGWVGATSGPTSACASAALHDNVAKAMATEARSVINATGNSLPLRQRQGAIS